MPRHHPEPAGHPSLDSGRRRWVPLVAVYGVFIATMLVVPVFAAVAVSDDWLWARAVESLLRDGNVWLPDLTAPTLLFQLLWGAAFSWLLEPTFGVLRLSTVVLVLASGLALFGLCRELGVSPRRSALAVAVYLFHPLAYGLTFTFMTDPHFMALLVIASFLYVRGLRPDSVSPALVVLGSVAAGCAFLVRPQGALIPVAVVVYLVAARRLRLNRAGAVLLARVSAVPLATVAGYQLWLNLVHGVPTGQRDFLGNFRQSGLAGNLRLAAAVAFVSAMYVGLFVLPLVVATIPRLFSVVRSLGPGRLLLAAGLALSVVLGVVVLARRDRLMPYAGLFLDNTGIGPQDVVGGRRPLVGRTGLAWITAGVALATLTVGLVLLRPPARAWRGGAGLVLSLAAWQLIGILPPSGQKVIGGTRIITFDRYLLVLLPFGLCLVLWALRDVRLSWAPAVAATAALGVFSVAGTRDLLAWQKATWALAHEANCMGVPNHRFDAGHAWTGYYVSDGAYPREPSRTPPPRPWWVEQLGPSIDSAYQISTVVTPGHTVVKRVEYSQWLQAGPTHLYLLRRQATAGPPPPELRPRPCSPAPRRLRTREPA